MSNYEGFEGNIPDEEFVDRVHAKGLPLDVAELMHREIQETRSEGHNVIFIGTDGDKTIKAIHVPSSALGGGSGPVLFAGADDNLIIAAFSNEFMDENASRIDEEEPRLRPDMWLRFMEKLHDMVEDEYADNPPVWNEVL